MARVSTVNLSPDAREAGATLGTTELGELAPETLLALLGNFQALDAVQNFEADPHISLVTPTGKFLVRTGRGKLFLYNARDTIEPYAELSAAEIVSTLERDQVTAAPFASAESAAPSAPPSPHRVRHLWTAAAILFTGVALNGFTLYSVFYTQTVVEQPVVSLITEAAELAARQHDVVGTYATGDKPGDRTITVDATGRVHFREIGSKNRLVNNTDAFRLGRRDRKICLATNESGIIDLVDVDTLSYFRDTYRRVR